MFCLSLSLLGLLPTLKGTAMTTELSISHPSSEDTSYTISHQHPALDLKQTQVQQLYARDSKFSDLCKLNSFREKELQSYYNTLP